MPLRLRRIQLSMVVATYNVAPYLDAFFDSLIAQTAGLGGLEVIVVNDGSTDGSGAIAQGWADRYPQTIRVLNQDNQGVAAARNAGLAQATGEWVCFPDPDDFLSPDYLAQMRAEISRPGVRKLVAVTARLVFYHEDTDTMSDTHALRGRFGKTVTRHDSTDMGEVLLPHTSCTFMRRADIVAHGLTFDSQIRPSFEDAHFIIRLLLLCPGRTVSFLPDPIYYYRKRQAGTSQMDRITTDPAWYGPHLKHAYLSLLEMAQALRGKVPDFVQNNVILSLLAKLRAVTGPQYDPDLLDAAGRQQFMDHLTQVMAYIPEETLLQAKVPHFYLIHRLALLTLFKTQPHPPARVVLHATSPEMAGIHLRWVLGGDTSDDVQIVLDGTALPVAARICTKRMLFDQTYVQIFHQPIDLQPGQDLQVLVGGQPVQVHYKKQTLNTRISYAQLMDVLA